MRISRSLLTVLAICAATGLAAAEPSSTMNASHMPDSVTIPLGPQSNSAEHGTAMLTQKGSNVIVSIRLVNAKGMQPAHIHAGFCNRLNAMPAYGLNTVIDGRSTTILYDVSLAALFGKYAINVHKSNQDLRTYVACGNIVK